MSQANKKISGLGKTLGAILLGATLLSMSGCSFDRQPFDKQPEQKVRPTAQPYGQHPAPPSTRPEPAPTAYDVPPTKVVKVGLLLPLTGRSAALGKSLQDAGVMAMFDKYATLSGPAASLRLELIPQDTKGTNTGAKKAAADAIKEGAELIIGPLYSQEVEAIKPLGATGKIAIISFSNNPEVAGDGTFIMGFNPAEQTRRVMRFAFTTGGVKRLAILAPNDAYGRQVTKAAEEEAKLFGVELNPVIHYTSGSSAVKEDVKKLAMEGSAGARLNFDALFLPEGGAQLEPILTELKAANISPRNVQFIGTGLWDDTDIIKQHDLNGAWIASGPPYLYESFEKHFVGSYGYKPPRIASLSYDAVALAATLVTTQGGLNRDSMADPSGYSGPANGIFRFLPNGTVERGLAVVRIENGQFVLLDPAPAAFK